MKWPDVIQCIAYQYGQTFTEDQVRNMTFQEKSKWLRSNPVTAARHFHYHLNTFFQKFLNSCANPLGKLTDYAIKIEFQARGSPHAHTLLWIEGAPLSVELMMTKWYVTLLISILHVKFPLMKN